MDATRAGARASSSSSVGLNELVSSAAATSLPSFVDSSVGVPGTGAASQCNGVREEDDAAGEAEAQTNKSHRRTWLEEQGLQFGDNDLEWECVSVCY